MSIALALSATPASAIPDAGPPEVIGLVHLAFAPDPVQLAAYVAEYGTAAVQPPAINSRFAVAMDPEKPFLSGTYHMQTFVEIHIVATPSCTGVKNHTTVTNDVKAHPAYFGTEDAGYDEEETLDLCSTGYTEPLYAYVHATRPYGPDWIFATWELFGEADVENLRWRSPQGVEIYYEPDDFGYTGHCTVAEPGGFGSCDVVAPSP
jgi:hypothetical protein